ncbi:MAG: oligoendopeptidase F [Pirellulales bacterium]
MSTAQTRPKAKAKVKVKSLPPRSKVKPADTWDLASLYPDDASWEIAFTRWEKQIPGYEKFKDTLAESAQALAACLKFDSQLERTGERLGTYAFLKTAEDTANSDYQRMMGRFRHAASLASQAASYIRPEILAIPTARLKKMIGDRALRPYRLRLERLARYKPHTLSNEGENLLAMQSEMAGAASQIFRQLNDADLKFGSMRNEKGESIELTTSTFSSLLHSPNRSVRRNAFHQFYTQYAAHENTLASTLAGSMQRDAYYAKARNYESARSAALFDDNVPESVYDNLIEAVHRHLPALYRYYELRCRKMRLKDIHHYDTYVPILNELETRHTWRQAVRGVIQSLEPLGGEYCQVLEAGLLGRWCDRYPNRGKQSGAFSCGTFDGDPYIMMNYQPDVLDHVFTLTHEAGHSMHSFYSSRSQPFEHYDYSIFVAEVASTFNEQLLSRHMLAKARTRKDRAFLINRDIDAIRGTILRQTMFAEFEKITHELVEQGEPLTVARFKEIYGDLLRLYFGPDFAIDEELRLECFRIPHFYRAFYVYKYATGMSAAIALAERVTSGGQRELDDYLRFLSGGSSKYPLDLLRDAGVDIESPEPIDTALTRFNQLVEELEELL